MKRIMLNIAFLIFIVIFEINLVIASCPSGIISYWTFDNDDVSGNTLIDTVGNSNGTIYGATVGVAGKVGQALSFDGVDDYVNAGHDNSLNPANELTILAWAKVGGKQGSHRTIVAKGHDMEQYMITASSENKFRPHLHVSACPGGITCYNGWLYPDGNTDVALDEWFFLAETYDGTTLKFYVNGNLDASWNINYPISYASTSNNLFIGNLEAQSYYFDGLIDEVAIFNRSLSASEISTLYSLTNNGKGYCDLTETLAISDVLPANNTKLVFGTTSVLLRVSTNLNASCKYSSSPNQDFSSMTSFTNTGHTTHNTTISGLVDGGEYDYYIKCQNANNASEITDDYHLHFSIVEECSGMISYWTFDNDSVSGNTLIDTVGNSNGTIYGATVGVAGKVGQALSFDGVDDYVNAGHDNSLNPANELTILAWAKVGGKQGSHRTIVAKGHDMEQYMITASSENKFRPHLHVSACPGGITCYNGWLYPDGNTDVALDEWFFLAETYDGTTLKFYVNGNLDASWNINYPISYASTSNNLFIGNLEAQSYYFDGLIDEVAIFNRSLSASEIQMYYYKSLNGQGYCSTLLPVYSSFTSPETTDFSALLNLTNVTMPVLATPHARIKWLGSGYNASGKNFDQAVKLLHNFVSVDTSLLKGFNRSANITFKDVSYPNLGAYRIIKNGVTECTAPECVKLSASPVKFRVSHFSNYTTEGTSVPEFSHSKLLLVLFAGLICVFLFFRQKS